MTEHPGDDLTLDGDHSLRPPKVEELLRYEEWAASQTGDYWEVRDGEVRLTRLPREGETLPAILAEPPFRGRTGGGHILPVRGPNGELLSSGRWTE
jgi:hypothetical protein